MTWFADLTPHTYTGLMPFEVNTGWLDEAHSFPTAIPSQDVLDILEHLTNPHGKHLVDLYMGSHECNICPKSMLVHPDSTQTLRISRTFGNGSLKVRGNKGITYVAPQMIYHYVKVHHYAPPQEFIDALLLGQP